VDILYRFDFRSFDEIFANGFTARGDDRNLISHALTWTDRSAFIAATSNFDAVLRVASWDMEESEDPQAVGYIYGIAASNDFYHVTPSLESFLGQQRALPVSMRNQEMEDRLELSLDAYWWEREYVSVAPVPAEAVLFGIRVSAGRDRHGRFQLQWGQFQTHPAEGQHSELTNAHVYGDEHPMEWPPESPPPPSSPLGSPHSCEDASGVHSGAIGVNCSGDLHGVTDGMDHIQLAMLPACHSPVREKRDTGVPLCFGNLPLVNISRLVRLRTAAFSSAAEDWSSWPEAGRAGHDEL
jgi:hypothetical protein